MIKASYAIPYHLQNKLFDVNDKSVNRDNGAYCFVLLKQVMRDNGIDLSTYDINPIESSEIIIYHDMPKILPKDYEITKSYLILFESEIIKSDNWDLSKHRHFKKIFTWNDTFVDNKKYFKINFSHLIPDSISMGMAKEKKLCTLIAGNKKVSHPKELYSKRVEAIRWFEKYHPDDFDLYGMGWRECIFQNKHLNYLFRKLKLSSLFKANFPSYKGSVTSKKDVLQQYKFAICYENARDISGYITEKIFDCFFAGCIPVYWGANNIAQHIPHDCFIDRRNFSDTEAVYRFIKGVTEEEIVGYQKRISEFLQSEAACQFSAEYFAETIVNTIVEDLGY